MPPSLYLLLFVYLYTLVFVFFLTFIPLGGHLTWGRAFPLLGFYLPLIILLIRSYPVNTIYSFHSSVHLFMFSFKVYARYVHCHISGQFFPGVKLRIDLTRQIYATHSPKAAKSAVNFPLGYSGDNLPVECKYSFAENLFPISHELFRVASARVPQRYKEQKDYCLILNVRSWAGTIDHFLIRKGWRTSSWQCWRETIHRQKGLRQRNHHFVLSPWKCPA